MAFEKKTDILMRDSDPVESSFEALLDTACERLWEKRIQYSIKRIKEMDAELKRLEEELDEFIDPGHD